jgi:hypothetical protein
LGERNEKIEVEKMITSTLLREFIFLYKTKTLLYGELKKCIVRGFGWGL